MQSALQFFKLAVGNACGTKTGIFPSIYDGLTCENNSIKINGVYDIITVIGNIISILIYFAGALAVIFIIVGGIYFVTAMGDPARLKRAKEIITQAITGLIIVLVAYGAVTFIASKF